MTRTFIALEMNESLQSHLAGVIRQVAQVLPSVRFVDADGIHLTLAFLGELSDARLAEAMEAAEAAATQSHPFSYHLTRLGVFGPARNPRVIWMGIDEPGGVLSQLHRSLNHELVQRGFEVDTRPFSPHLTLARVKHPLTPAEQQQFQQLLMSKQQGIVSSHTYPAGQLDVMKSELYRSGAQYTRLKACVLGTSHT